VPLEIHRRWRERTGREIHEGYGMTEMAPITGTTLLSGVRPGSVGPALPGVTLEIVDVETGREVLAAGEKGEIRVRGPHMMQGYRGHPEETARVLREGYLYTGDIGYLDAEGFLHITDRKKDMILVKGFNVYPREVEEVLHAHPAVAQAGVIGAPDARSGERVVAFVVPRHGAALDREALLRHCAELLAPYQCPAEIHILEALPMTGAHKLDRLALRRLLEGRT
jgi:long-chain acyl-CoA synthetase